MKNNLLLKALSGTNTGRPPIWLMRQAGRYMPQYRSIREKHSFLEMCYNPELVAEVTQLPIKEFGFDAAILFSDILLIAQAHGVGLRFDEGIGPIIERPVRSRKDVENLANPVISEVLGNVTTAIKMLKAQLDVPLLGFCGAPFTVASYMIEGKSSRDLKLTKQWMLRDPEGFHQLLEKIAKSTIEQLKMQIAAGVDAVQIFDSWANYLAFGQFQEFSLKYLKMLIEGIKHTNVPVILFCRGSSVFAPELAKASPTAISLDWNCDISKIRQQLPHITLQGNLDPDILYAPKEVLQKEVKGILKSMHNDPAFIFNLGHGIHPDTPTDSVKTLIETIQNYN